MGRLEATPLPAVSEKKCWFGQVETYAPLLSVSLRVVGSVRITSLAFQHLWLCRWSGTLYFPCEWMKMCIDIFIYIYSAFHPRPCMFTVKCGTIKYTQYRERKIQTGGGGGGGGETISIISRQKHLYNCSCGTRSVSLDLSKTLTRSIYFKSGGLCLTSSSILLNTPSIFIILCKLHGL